MGIRGDMRKLIQTIYVDSTPRSDGGLGPILSANLTNKPLGR